MAIAPTKIRSDPYKGFRFRLEIQGMQVAGFSEVTLPEGNVDSTTYREGTDGPIRKLSGLPHVGTLSLKRGITDSMDLHNWYKAVTELGATGAGRKNISVILIDDMMQEKVRWNIANAWPSKYTSSDFNASSSDAMIETLEVELESITRVT
jgi:phage tail-like protein